MQQFLKSTPGSTGTRIIAAEFLDQVLVGMNDAVATFHVVFGGESLTTLARGLERKTICCACSLPWRTSWSTNRTAAKCKDCQGQRQAILGSGRPCSRTTRLLRVGWVLRPPMSIPTWHDTSRWNVHDHPRPDNAQRYTYERHRPEETPLYPFSPPIARYLHVPVDYSHRLPPVGPCGASVWTSGGARRAARFAQRVNAVVPDMCGRRGYVTARGARLATR